MAEFHRFAAFISYSSKDAAFARRLHRALESYGIPTSLGKFDLVLGGRPNRIYPVFRDREELAAGRLGERIEASLQASAALIVVCSPNSAASPWVEAEIELFAGLGRRDRIFAIVSDTAPLADASGADVTASYFPPAFRASAFADATAMEPLAADARKGRDGFRNAWLKVVAGLIGVTPGQIIDRDRRRRARQRLLAGSIAACSLVVLAAAGAVVDTRSVRSDFTAQGSVLTSAGHPLEAAAFALAGEPSPGDMITIRAADADQSVLKTGVLVPIAEALGQGEIDHFSEDGRFLETEAQDGAVTVHDLRDNGPAIQLGRLGAIGPGGDALEFSSDGRFTAMRGRGGSVVLRDLQSPGPPVSLGPANAFYFSSDGRYLLLKATDGDATLRPLRPLGPTIRLGPVDSFAFSPDGRFLAIRTTAGQGALRDLRSDAPPTALGQVDDFGFSADDRLLVIDADHAGSLRDLRDGRPVVQLGWIDDFTFSNDGRFLEVRDQDGASTLRDLAAGGPVLALGALQGDGFAFSPDSRFMVTAPVGRGATLRALGPGGRSDPLGQIDDNLGLPGFGFSGDGRLLLTIAEDNAALLRDLSGGRAPIPLGPLRDGGFEFSSDGRFLLTCSPDSEGALRDLRAQLPNSNGAAVRAEACRASGDALLPFPAQLRTDVRNRQALYRALRGRPWNPCDWRGLLSILPDPEAGDGWFEGARQWLRLMSVRYFGGQDWSCEEATSQASSQARLRRRAMCLLSAEMAKKAATSLPA